MYYSNEVNVTKANNYQKQHLQMFFKIGVLKNFAIFTGKQLYRQETPTQIFFCEYTEIFMNIYFHRTPLVAVSVLYLPAVILSFTHFV